MYFTAFHIFSIFAFFCFFIFGEFLLYYYIKDKKKFQVFSLILFLFISLASYSTLMTLDATLKSVELRNINYYKSSNDVVLTGSIYNTGKAGVSTCDLNTRIISAKTKKIDGSIFDTSRRFDRYLLDKPRNSYTNDFTIKEIIMPNATKSFRVLIPFPPHFEEYKIKAKISCK